MFKINKERLKVLRARAKVVRNTSILLIQRRARERLKQVRRVNAVKVIQERLRNLNVRRGSMEIEISTKDSIWKEIKRLRSSGAKEARMSLVEDGDVITTFIILDTIFFCKETKCYAYSSGCSYCQV